MDALLQGIAGVWIEIHLDLRRTEFTLVGYDLSTIAENQVRKFVCPGISSA
ncbi:hypothetical protein Q5425_31380 [Amycolatopsis sp. A133]|uniref:hypothetical protein n=1 Tax=Amycolatopsis sp. A133 TaxID=3064472 RepID=UPI0027F9CA46|nr:hypothetical protein [Amycolatopsis sp. A133]MDQ7808258.1 hypothetical protein [Amycolatopsis sp. A133]